MSQSGYELNLIFQIKAMKLPAPTTQHRFHPVRRWTFDLAWPDQKLACEVEGGIFIKGGGRHNRAAGFAADTVKYNEAALAGWRVLRVTTQQVKGGDALRLLERALVASDDAVGPLGIRPAREAR